MTNDPRTPSPRRLVARRSLDRGFAALRLPGGGAMPVVPAATRPRSVLSRLLASLGKNPKTVAIAVGVSVLVILVAIGAWAIYRRTRGRGRVPGDEAAAGVYAEGRPAIADALDLLNESVIAKTMEHFHPAKSMVEMTARMLSKYSSIRADAFWERYCLDVLEKFPQVDNFYIADAGGSRVIAARKDGIYSDVIDRSGPEPVRIEKRWDAAGKLKSVEKHTESELKANPDLGGLDASGEMYDPRNRPWYTKAEKALATCWSDVYVFNVKKVPGVTVACPTIGPGGAPIFVVAADYEIEKMSGFVAELNVGRQGLAFIVNAAGDLVAYPVPGKVLSTEDGKPVFAKAAEVVPDWVRRALEAYEDKQQEVFAYVHKGSRYIASFAPFPRSFGTDWRMVVVAPEEDLLSIAGPNRLPRPGGRAGN